MDEARILQQLVVWPSTQTLKEATQKNQIRKCSITTDEIRIAEYIYGPQIPIIQGKSIRSGTEHQKTIPRIPLTHLMDKHYQNVDLAMDFFFVNGSPLLHKKSRKVDFMSVQACNNRGK